MPFRPQRVIFESDALAYPMGEQLWRQFQGQAKVVVEILQPKQRLKPQAQPINNTHLTAKRTLIVGVRKTLKFQTCKPSAHYQLPLVTGCPGSCEYCYLQTQFGKNPYLRIYVNVEEILAQAARYANERLPQTTIFEGAAVSDPVPLEPYTGSLARAIEFFAQQDNTRFRFVTKFTDVDSLLKLDHAGKTTIRFSVNTASIIRNYEHGVPGLSARLQAARKVGAAGYPLGFIIGPVFLSAEWEKGYQELLDALREELAGISELSFEVISHRFTARAKSTIQSLYPETTLPMDEVNRRYKYGQFGYGKYVYPDADLNRLKTFFSTRLDTLFPSANIQYII